MFHEIVIRTFELKIFQKIYAPLDNTMKLGSLKLKTSMEFMKKRFLRLREKMWI